MAFATAVSVSALPRDETCDREPFPVGRLHRQGMTVTELHHTGAASGRRCAGGRQIDPRDIKVPADEYASHHGPWLGCAGAGKTTFAHRLGQRLTAPVICLDGIWRPDWDGGDLAEFRALVAEEHRRDAWISDGNFARATFDLRLPNADMIVWLERPTIPCAWRAVTRTFWRGEAHRFRDIMKVLRYIWSFDRVNRPLIEAQRVAHGPDVPVLHVRSKAETERFLLELEVR